jgi:hypothetical protein
MCELAGEHAYEVRDIGMIPQRIRKPKLPKPVDAPKRGIDVDSLGQGQGGEIRR